MAVVVLIAGVPSAAMWAWAAIQPPPPPTPKADVALELEKRIADLEAAPAVDSYAASTAAFQAAKDEVVQGEPPCSTRRLDFVGAQARYQSVSERRLLPAVHWTTDSFYDPYGHLPQAWEKLQALQGKMARYATDCPGQSLGLYHQRANEHIAGTMAKLEAMYRDQVVPSASYHPSGRGKAA